MITYSITYAPSFSSSIIVHVQPKPHKRVQVEVRRKPKVEPTQALELKIPVVGLQGHFAIQNLLAVLAPDWVAKVIEEDQCQAQPEYVLYTIQLLRRSEVENVGNS